MGTDTFKSATNKNKHVMALAMFSLLVLTLQSACSQREHNLEGYESDTILKKRCASPYALNVENLALSEAESTAPAGEQKDQTPQNEAAPQLLTVDCPTLTVTAYSAPGAEDGIEAVLKEIKQNSLTAEAVDPSTGETITIKVTKEVPDARREKDKYNAYLEKESRGENPVTIAIERKSSGPQAQSAKVELKAKRKVQK